MKQNKTEYLVFGLFFVIGLFFLIVGTFLTIHELDQTGKITTTGTITSIRVHHNTNGDDYDVFVAYNVDGKSYENIINFYSSTYREGQEIEIYYMEDNPNQIGAKAMETFVFIFPGLGLLFTIIGGVALIILIGKKNNGEKLKKSGELVYANLKEIIYNTSYTVNGQSPFIILCTWYNPEDSQNYTFKSENIWWDPSYVIGAKNITSFPVYINRKNLKQYYVDITEITENPTNIQY